MYQKLLKESNGDHKYFKCTGILNNKLYGLCSENLFDRVEWVCSETVKAKYAANDSSYIIYSNSIYFVGIL